MDIDIVVLWVDGDDPAWRAELAKYSPGRVDDSNSDNRFRDWGLMPYWFRAVEAFAPWVRRIHFVTWGHTPAFLRLDHPRLHVVNHRDFMPPEDLPSFNACALEMNVHRIEGLSEHFIYFNDDMFLLRPLAPEYFFKNGLPRAHFAEVPLGFVGRTKVWQLLCANDLGIVNKYFDKRKAQRSHPGKYYNLRYHWYDNLRSAVMGLLYPHYYTGFKNMHAPAAYLKSTFETLWPKEPELLARTSAHRFRDRDDVNQWLALWWQVAAGQFCPLRMNTSTVAASEAEIREICDSIVGRKHEMICINDPEEAEDVEKLSAALREAFERLLPGKCSFERE